MAISNQFKIESNLSEVKVMASHFCDFCKGNHIDEEAYNLLELALVEALNNIINHAYDGQPRLEIHAKYEFIDSIIIITLTDSGKPFPKQDLEKEPIKTVSLDEELPEGNWGLGLISSITDVVIRYRVNEINTLILKTKINT